MNRQRGELVAETSRKRSNESGKLDAAAWTEAALDMLAVSGIDGVRVELLAKQLAVTKGSFYWHFRDREALLEQMLSLWRKRATLALIERLDRIEEPAEVRLRRLLRVPLEARGAPRAADVELAVRMWGRRDPRAAAALEEVDQLRLHYIAGLLDQCGALPDEANARAILAYSYMRVAASLVPADAKALVTQCENLLIGNFGKAERKAASRRRSATCPAS